MSVDAQNIKEALGERARDIICTDYGRDQKDKICCFMHPDKTPSLHWHRDANHFYCFGGCGTYDIFDHYQQFYGLSFPESLETLANMAGYRLTERYEKPEFVRKTKVEVKPEYIEKINTIQYDSNYAADYLASKGIDFDLAVNDYLVGASKTEIFFRHYEIVNNQWAECFSKRRKLDGTKYEFEDTVTKEISIAGGQQSFYGETSLFNKSGEFKSYAIITEGHLDCLRTATACKEEGFYEVYGVLSVPNGSKTLKTALENSPTFTRFFRQCKYIILIPDADEAGKLMVEYAKKYLQTDKVKWCDLDKFPNVRKGTDISDILNLGDSLESVLEKQDFIPIDNCHNARYINIERIKPGFKSGFATHDWNDSGLKDGGLTLLTGFRGQGKTTLARQIVMCGALQNVKSFCWFGEGNINQEVSRFARMCAEKGDIDSYDNGSGRALFSPNHKAVEYFRSHYADNIIFYDGSNVEGNIFDNLMSLMIQNAIRGAKLFLLDNLMVMTNATGRGVFQEQERIIGALKKFAVNYQVHVMLIAHPKKGEGYQSISGSASIENTADSILRYVRTDFETAQKVTAVYQDFPAHEVQNISAMVLNEKVRDEGESNPIFLEWDKYKGIVREISYIDQLKDISNQYLKQGWFSRPASYIGM